MHKCCNSENDNSEKNFEHIFCMKILTKVITYSVEDNNKKNFNWADEIINITTKKKKTDEHEMCGEAKKGKNENN